jgi:hypothetical protein
MSRSVLAPLAVALSALLVAPQIQAEPTAPLFVVEQQRSALVTRLAKQWSDAFAVLPKERRLDHEQLSSALFALRADRLFAVTLAGDVDAVESVLSDAKREVAKPRASTKALGDVTADLAYTPINPCRIIDTRSTVAGPLAPNVARTFDGYSTNFASQGGTGSGCGIPNGVAALAMNVYAVNPTNLGFIKVWQANGTEPDVSTVNYQVGITAIATGALVPVDAANTNRFTAKSPATVDFIADVVGYFKPPGDATSLDIKVAGQRVMRYEYIWNTPNVTPNVIGGSLANSAFDQSLGATVAGGGTTEGTGCYGRPCANRAGYLSAVGGGRGNVARSLDTVAGGDSNTASGGGSTIAGGSNNTASGQPAILTMHSTVGGGFSNTASGLSATIPGGQFNVASGYYSFAAGSRAKTQTDGPTPTSHDGVFIWADSNNFDFNSTAANELAARATGGVRFVTAIDGTGAPAWTCGVSGGAGGSWGCTSDRDTKTDLTPLDGVATLERLALLPVYQWAAKDDPRRIPHAGPTAQDFMAAFGLGDNDRMIGFADAQGVAFAAIQGLRKMVKDKDAEIGTLKQELGELRRAVETLISHTSPGGRVAEGP